MNKYLEKIAGVVPRNIGRMIQKGLPGMKADLNRGMARASNSFSKEREANTREFFANHKKETIKKMSTKPLGTDASYGTAEAKAFKATKDAKAAATRSQRSAKAARLHRDALTGANSVKQIAIGGTVGAVGAGAASAAAKKAKD